MSQTPIELVAYTPAWTTAYEREAARIREAAGEHVVALEHVGSTAVPGLAAKPIVDLLGGVERLADADAAVDALEAIGYDYCPAFEESLPQRRYFRRTVNGHHTHHLHVVRRDSDFWDRHVRFRDCLREDPDLARAYEQLKRRLARDHTDDIDGYTEGKTEFIERVLDGDRDGWVLDETRHDAHCGDHSGNETRHDAHCGDHSENETR